MTKPRTKLKILKIVRANTGRMISLKIRYDDTTASISNIYAPHEDWNFINYHLTSLTL